METTPNLGLYDAFLRETGPDRLQKILARYELFRMTLSVPGDIVECGVFKGSGLFTWIKLMSLFKPNCDFGVIGFDFFEQERKAEFKYQVDTDVLDQHAEGWLTREQLTQTAASWGFRKLNLVAGNVVETTRSYAEKEVGRRLSLLYIDVDNFEGAQACLDNLYPMVSPGGVIAFDEYGLPGYGESEAVDAFLARTGLKLQWFNWANTPTGYVVKP